MTTRAFLFLALGGACLSLTACGGATAIDPVASAATKTAKVESARFHVDTTETAGRLGPLHLSADGVADNATHSMEMTMDLSSIAQALGSQAGSPDQWKADVLLDGTVVYMRLPVLSRLLPGAKPWLKLDLQRLGAKVGVNFSQLMQSAESQDPTQALHMLESVGEVLKAVTEQVSGVDTTEYRGTVDPQKVVAKLSGTGIERFARELGTQPIPVQVWIGDDGLVRKLHESLSVGAASLDMTFELSDFGTPVNVTAPPAAEVTDISNLKGH